MKIKIIIFDLYDTLIEIGEKLNPYESLFNSLGKTKPEIKNLKNLILTNNFDNIREIVQKLNLNPNDILSEKVSKMIESEVRSTYLYNESYSTLERLSKNYKIFCLSNLATPYKEPYFNLGLNNIIEKEFFSCDLGDKKPNSSFFQKVLNYAEVNPSESLMIGNSLYSDYNGALSCGVNAVLKNKPLDILFAEMGI